MVENFLEAMVLLKRDKLPLQTAGKKKPLTLGQVSEYLILLQCLRQHAQDFFRVKIEKKYPIVTSKQIT